MGKKGFKDLMVWQQAKDLAVIVYRLSDVGALSKDYSLRDQIRRSVISIASNLAEGDERDTDKESVHFFYIAKGSLAELRTQIEIAHEIGYLEKKYFEDIDGKCIVLGKMIDSLIKVRKAGRANRGSKLISNKTLPTAYSLLPVFHCLSPIAHSLYLSERPYGPKKPNRPN